MSDPDAAVTTLVSDLARVEELIEDGDRSVHQLWAVIDLLTEVLLHRGVLAPGHQQLIRKIRAKSPALRAKVRLYPDRDKYGICGPDIDCVPRLSKCFARCCALSADLGRQDLEEGKFIWNVDEPYVLVRDDDGYCTHLDRGTGKCTEYECRPARCREFDCRTDERIWKDFAAGVATPMWNGTVPPRALVAAEEAEAEKAEED